MNDENEKAAIPRLQTNMVEPLGKSSINQIQKIEQIRREYAMQLDIEALQAKHGVTADDDRSSLRTDYRGLMYHVEQLEAEVFGRMNSLRARIELLEAALKVGQ